MISITLASGSPRRRELLQTLGVDFTVRTMPTEELTAWPDPYELPVLNAVRKAEAVAALEPDRLVLGADTVIVFQNQVIGKPADAADARRILTALSGATHEVVTGVALICRETGFRHTFSAITKVAFRAYDAATVTAYLNRVEVLDKAGAYAIQEDQGMLLDHIDGSWSNIVGLPLEALAAALPTAYPTA